MKTILFFDDWLLQARTGLQRKLGEPQWVPDGTLEDDATEGVLNYPTVWRDSTKNKWFALYGGAAPHSNTKKFHVRTQVLLLASSDDAIHWRKEDVPANNYVKWRTNQVFSGNVDVCTDETGGARVDGAPVYYDEQEQDPNKRLKYLYRYIDENAVATTMLAVSSDGYRWSVEEPKWGKTEQFHCPVPLFYDHHRGKTVLSNWFALHDRRIVFRDIDDELESISDARLVLQADAEDELLAETYAMPVFSYDGLYIGLLWMFHPDTGKLERKHLTGYMDCYLAYSYDGSHFQRAFHVPFIGRNPQGEHGGGSIFVSSMIAHENEIRFYSGGSKAKMFYDQGVSDAAIMTHVLRRDGFVSLQAQDHGYLATKAMILNAPSLEVNVLAPNGSLRAQISDGNGPINGFTFDRSICVSEDDVAAHLQWKDRDLSELIGKPIFLEIEIENGSLFAIRGDFNFVGATGTKIY